MECFNILKVKNINIEHDIDRFIEDFSYGFENITKYDKNLMEILVRSYYKYKVNIYLHK